MAPLHAWVSDTPGPSSGDFAHPCAPPAREAGLPSPYLRESAALAGLCCTCRVASEGVARPPRGPFQDSWSAGAASSGGRTRGQRSRAEVAGGRQREGLPHSGQSCGSRLQWGRRPSVSLGVYIQRSWRCSVHFQVLYFKDENPDIVATDFDPKIHM